MVESVLAIDSQGLMLTGQDLPENVNTASLPSNSFQDLGVPPALRCAGGGAGAGGPADQGPGRGGHYGRRQPARLRQALADLAQTFEQVTGATSTRKGWGNLRGPDAGLPGCRPGYAGGAGPRW